ncbi:hypothetical protein Mapa_006915 [Marchantia paleacea]|nr:hypothetical protein Mapa_006915 [Marchantia paleacea]
MPGHLSATEAPEDLWTCHECGWTYPNHHPSAKHRRNHKKVCGSIPGFIGTISSRKAPPEPEPSMMDGASSDDASSDDECTPDKTHEKCGHHHPSSKVAPMQQTAAAVTLHNVQHGGTRAAKSLCVSHRSKEPCLHGEEAMKPAPLTERTLSDQNNRQALQSTASNLTPAAKTQHVRRRSAHALEGVWVCRHCGWTYPNAHPSAKHRRKHKKKCPALVVTRHAVAAGGSSDDASSDEENRIQRAAALQNAEAPETNNLPMPGNLSLEAFLSRSGSMNGGSAQHASLRELQAPIILLSPRPASRRDSFLSPRHRREGPSLLLSPRGSMKNPKANNQAQEVAPTIVTERKSEAVSDLENEDPEVVLNLPTVRTVTIPPAAAPAAAADESVGGDTLQEGRRSLSDESDLNNSDGEAPRSPVSVLQTRHLLVPTATSTTTEETKTSDQEETDEEATEQLLHQEAAAAFSSDAHRQKDESTDEVAVNQRSYEAVSELPPPPNCEALPKVDSSMSHPPTAAADQKESQGVSSVNIIQPVDASPCTELQAAVTGAICVAKETEVAKEAYGKVSLSEELGTSLASVDNNHEQKLGSNTDGAVSEEHVSSMTLAVGESSDAASQDTNRSLILDDTDCVNVLSAEKDIEGHSYQDLDSINFLMTDNVVANSTVALVNDFSSQEARREMSTAEVTLQEIEADHKEASDNTGSAVALASEQESTCDLHSSESPTIVPVLDTKDEGQISTGLPVEVVVCAYQPAAALENTAAVVEEEEEEDRALPSFSSEVLPVKAPMGTTVEVVKEDTDLPTSSSEHPSADQPPVELAVEAVQEEDGDLSTSTSEVPSAAKPPVATTVEVVSEKDQDLPTLRSEVASADQPPVDTTVEVVNQDDRDLPASSSEALPSDQPPVTVTSPVAVEEQTEESDLPTLSSEVSSAHQPPVGITVEVVNEENRDLPTLRSPEVLLADQPPVIITVEVDEKGIDLPTSSSEDLPADRAPVPVTVEAVKEEEEEDRGLPPSCSQALVAQQPEQQQQPPVEVTAGVVQDTEERNLPVSSSEVLSSDQHPVDLSGVAEKEVDNLVTPVHEEVLIASESQMESLSEVQETTDILLVSSNASQVPPTTLDTPELGSQSIPMETLIPTTQSTKSTAPAPDAITEDDSSSGRSDHEKVQESFDVKPADLVTPSTAAMGISDQSSETLPTSKSQVVVTGPVGDCDLKMDQAEENKSDQTESRVTDVVVEEKTTSSVAIDSHLSAGKQELPEASHHHSGAAEDLWTFQRNPKKNRREAHGSDAIEGSWDDVSEVQTASRGAFDAMGSELKASRTPGSTSSNSEAEVVVDELENDFSTVTDVEKEKRQTSASPTLGAVGVVNIKARDGGVSTEKTAEAVVLAENSSTKSNIVIVEGAKVEEIEKSPGPAEATAAQRKSGAVKQEVVVHGKQAPPTVTIPELVQENSGGAAAAEKPAGLFGHWRAREGKRELQREPSLKREPRELTLPRLPGSGKRKALPALSFGTGDAFHVTKKQESRPGMKVKSRDLKSDSMKLRARARSCPPDSPPSSPPRSGGPGSPEGIVKVRIETYERLIGKTRTVAPPPTPSPSHKAPTFFGKFSSPQTPHGGGLTIVTSHPQFEHEEAAAASAEEQISAIAAHLHHVEPKQPTKVQDMHDAPQELLHEALSHLRHCELDQGHQQNNNEQDSLEPEDSSQRISKVSLVLKEAAEHCLSPVPRLTTAY